MDQKPFASLSSGLLARKGGARPAMRSGYVPGMSLNLPASVQDDLGWNDMGHDEDVPESSPPPLTVIKANGEVNQDAASRPEVLAQQAEISQAFEGEAEKPKRKIALRPRTAKAAFTLRLDPERHLRLRLACAVHNRSAQQIVTEALDAFLDGQPELEALASQVQQKNGTGKSGAK